MSNPYSFYNASNSLGFGMTGANAGLQKPYVAEGSYRLKPCFSSIFAKLSMGGVDPFRSVLSKYEQTMEEAVRRWALNMKELKGMDLTHDSTGIKNMLILPYSTARYHWYEDGAKEFRTVTVAATTKTIAGNVITFYVAAADIYKFNVQEVIANFSNSETKRAIVTSVNTSTNAVTIEATGNGAAAFTAVTDFFVGTTSLDVLDLLKGGYAYNSSANSGISRNKVPYDAPTVKYGETQLMKETFQEYPYFDENFKGDTAKNPQSQQEFEFAVARLIKQTSSTVLWGRKKDITSAQNYANFSGLDESITNSVTCSDGNLSISDIDQVLVDTLGNTHGSNVKYGFGSMPTLSHIETIINTAGVQAGIKMTKYETGEIGNAINVLSYRGNEIVLFPVSDFHDEGNRSFYDQTTTYGANKAGKLFIVDPACPKFVFGRRSDDGLPEIMRTFKDVNTREDQINVGKKHEIRNNMGFALVQPELCAKITNIQRPNTGG